MRIRGCKRSRCRFNPRIKISSSSRLQGQIWTRGILHCRRVRETMAPRMASRTAPRMALQTIFRLRARLHRRHH